MQKSFETLKQALTTAPVLAYPDFSKPFLVATDASSPAVGAVLSQLDENRREHPIYYASRSLNEAEKNYSTYEREGLAIVFALKKFRHYLLCEKFKLFMDHDALKYVINNRDTHGRIARWISIFSEYDFEVVYRSGPRSSNADCLSGPLEKENLVLTMGLESDWNSVAEYLSRGTTDRASSTVARAIKIRAKNYHMHGGELYRRTAKGLRFEQREKARISIMKGLHDDIGHWSFATTYQIISDRFWWPKIRIDVAYFVRSRDSARRLIHPNRTLRMGGCPSADCFILVQLILQDRWKRQQRETIIFYWL